MKQGNISSTPLETAELPVIDWNLCVKLANNKKEIAEELLALIMQQLPLDLNAIKQAFEQTNFPELLRYVHKLHGALCYSGLPRLKQVVSSLESMLKQKAFDLTKLAVMVKEIDVEAEKVLSSTLPV